MAASERRFGFSRCRQKSQKTVSSPRCLIPTFHIICSQLSEPPRLQIFYREEARLLVGVSKFKKSVVFNIEKTQAMCIGYIEMSRVDLAA